MPLVEMKNFNSLFKNKSFFDQPVKKQTRSVWKTRWNIKKWWLYKGNLLDYLQHQNNYKPIFIDLSSQANTSIPQLINFTWKLEADDGSKLFFIAEKQQKPILDFCLYSLNPAEWNIKKH